MDTDKHLSAWEVQQVAALKRERDVGGTPGIAAKEQISGKSGLEILGGMMSGELPSPPMNETMNMTLLEVDEGVAIFQGIPLLRHFNPMGTVHGGWFATILDSALGCAVQTMLSAGQTYTTVELSINLVRGASEQTGPLRATARVLHRGGRMATAEASLKDERGRLYAHATTTCFIFNDPES